MDALPLLDDLVEVGPELGRGAFGVVHRGILREGGAAVAVKLPLHGAEMVEPERILREARLLADLDHPSLNRLHGCARDADGRLALIYELLVGAPLDRVLLQGNPPIAQALTWIAELAGGLDALHRAELVHRDLKTENVFVLESGDVRLLDFGLLRPLAPGETLTRTGVLAGTPAFMAPELFSGSVASVRSDLYAFACIAFELLTGELPIDGSLEDVLAQAQGAGARKLSEAAPDLPRALDPIFDRALSRDPVRRPESAGELSRRIREVFEGSTLAAGRTRNLGRKVSSEPLTPSRGSPPAASRRGWAAAALLAGMLAVGFLGYSGDPDVPAGPAAPVGPGPLGEDFAERFEEELDRVGRFWVDPQEQLELPPAGDIPDGWRDVSGDPLYEALRQARMETVAELSRWLIEGGRPRDIDPEIRRKLEARQASLSARGLPRPLHPYLDLHPDRAEPLDFPPWIPLLPGVRAPRLEGWLALGVHAFTRAHAAGSAFEQRFEDFRARRPGAGALPESPGWRLFGGITRKGRPDLRLYLRHGFENPEVRTALGPYLVPIAEDIHTGLFAFGRAADAGGEQELFAAVLADALLLDTGEYVRNSYLCGFGSRRLLGSARDTAAWHLMAGRIESKTEEPGGGTAPKRRLLLAAYRRSMELAGSSPLEQVVFMRAARRATELLSKEALGHDSAEAARDVLALFREQPLSRWVAVHSRVVMDAAEIHLSGRFQPALEPEETRTLPAALRAIGEHQGFFRERMEDAARRLEQAGDTAP